MLCYNRKIGSFDATSDTHEAIFIQEGIQMVQTTGHLDSLISLF